MGTRLARFGNSLAVSLGTWLSCGVALAEGPVLAPGQTIRLTAPSRIEIPDVVTVEADGRYRTAGQVQAGTGFEGEGGRAMLSLTLGGRTLHVPKAGARVVGTLTAVDAETITLLRGGKTLSIPRGAATKVEIRRRAGHPGWGALAGFVLGYGIGYGIASQSDTWDSVTWVLLCIPGAIGGGVVGSRLESWELVSTESVKLAVAPRRGGAIATLTLAF